MMRWILVAAAASATSAASAANSDEILKNARDAVAALHRAADSIAPPGALLTAKTITFAGDGVLTWPYQGPSPHIPFDIKLGHKQHVDWETNRTLASQDYETSEASWNSAAALSHRDGSDAVTRVLRFSPHAVVREMLSQPQDLTMTRSGEVVTVAGRIGSQRGHLDMDAGSHRPIRLRLLQNQVVRGDIVAEVIYSSYQPSNGWTFPTSFEHRDAGATALKLTLRDYKVNAGTPAWHRAQPAPAAAAGPAAAAAPGRLTLQQVAPRIHLARNHGGADYHGLAVELDDGWMVLETPAQMGNGSELHQALRAVADKPIRYAVATHHHEDHSGGMGSVGDADTELVVMPGNQEYFRVMRTAPRTFAGAGVPSEPRFRIITDGDRIGPVQFNNVPSRHAREHLIFYLPGEKLLFQSDMARFAADGTADEARDAGCALLAFIDGRKLAVDRIVGGHGESGTVNALRTAVAKRKTACPPSTESA